MPHYDAHTHTPYPAASGVVGVVSCELGGEVPRDSYYSVGVHPANAEGVELVELRQELLQAASAQNCVAVGECGLDKRYEDFALQQEVFAVHVEVARELQKPLVIHCVRAIAEVLKLTKNFPYARVLHAYHKRDKNLERQEHLFFSLAHRNIEHSQAIPLELVLLESDDNQQTKIEELYEAFARQRGLNLSEVERVVEQNFSNVFFAPSKNKIIRE